MNRRLILAALAAAFTLIAQDGWTTYSSKAYGFSMLIPQGTEMEEREYKGGWAGAHGVHEGVEFTGIAKLGKHAERDIVAFGVEYTGIAENRWTQVDQGAGYKVYSVEDGDHILFAEVAVGSKAGYLLFLKTTKSDMSAHRAEYQKWYRSIRIQ